MHTEQPPLPRWSLSLSLHIISDLAANIVFEIVRIDTGVAQRDAMSKIAIDQRRFWLIRQYMPEAMFAPRGNSFFGAAGLMRRRIDWFSYETIKRLPAITLSPFRSHFVAIHQERLPEYW